MKSFGFIHFRTLAFAVITTAIAVQTNAETLKLDGKTMGTYYAIAIDGAPPSDAEAIQAQIETCLTDVNRQMSTWDPASEISRFNQSGNADWFAVSPEFASVVVESIRIHQLTGGAFDPTVAPLIDLWGFGSKRPKHFPTQEAIDAARGKVGMQFIEARIEPPSIRRKRPGVTLNLSAIAKGHGVDRVSNLLTSMGYPSHVVDIGGEDRTGIAKANGDKWRLGVESPFGEIYRVIECTEQSVATSGDYRNYFEIRGVRYSHAIDPTTGWPVVNPPASVSVLSDSCMTADGLATGLMVMGTERGMQFAERHGVSVLFLDVMDGRRIAVRATGKFNDSTDERWLPFISTLAVFLLALTAMTVSVIAARPGT
ncbi:MAG TPA: FAD:protein FMN transferase [Planctomycetaceae bacterium]|nr:FAD:protein FMN transferase [Planctomycetaceae bacterium]